MNHRCREARLLDTLEGIIASERRALTPLIVWRWRYELILAAGLTLAIIFGVRTLGFDWSIVAASVLAGVCSPPWPGWVIACAWHVITPHRLRSGMAQARIRNSRGRQPRIVRVTSEPFGERIRLWCPADVSADQIRAARTILRSACWAADVSVAPDERHQRLVTVDVIRRPEYAVNPDAWILPPASKVDVTSRTFQRI
jgi:hypothetical protein